MCIRDRIKTPGGNIYHSGDSHYSIYFAKHGKDYDVDVAFGSYGENPVGMADKICLLYTSTVNGAYQYFEENEKGTVTPGKKADFVVLEQNPLETGADEIRNIRVLATIKEDRLLWKA